MKREPLEHARVFDDPEFSVRYAARHERMGRKLGQKFASRFKARGLTGGKILDDGCGTGYSLLEILKAFPDASGFGIDLAEPLLDIARNMAQKEGLADRVKFENGDVEKLPFEDNSFDAVININMLHHVENPERMLGEIERVLKPGGFLSLADIKRSWFIGLFERVSKSAFTKKEAQQAIAKSGLRNGRLKSSLIWLEFEI